MKFTPLLAGNLSGKMGALVASHNRYGAYFRLHVIPTRSTTPEAIAAKARLALVSAEWKALTAVQRLSWNEWALENPVTDRIGARQQLTGNAAYVMLNARLRQAGGPSADTPPITVTPDPLLTLTLNGDIGTGAFDITFTGTPLAATEKLWVRETVVNSQAINYVENLLRVVTISATAQASPLDNQTDVEGRFGTLTVGQVVHAQVSVLQSDNGLLSAPLRAKVTVIDTV